MNSGCALMGKSARPDDGRNRLKCMRFCDAGLDVASLPQELQNLGAAWEDLTCRFHGVQEKRLESR